MRADFTNLGGLRLELCYMLGLYAKFLTDSDHIIIKKEYKTKINNYNYYCVNWCIIYIEISI